MGRWNAKSGRNSFRHFDERGTRDQAPVNGSVLGIIDDHEDDRLWLVRRKHAHKAGNVAAIGTKLLSRARLAGDANSWNGQCLPCTVLRIEHGLHVLSHVLRSLTAEHA